MSKSLKVRKKHDTAVKHATVPGVSWACSTNRHGQCYKLDCTCRVCHKSYETGRRTGKSAGVTQI